MHVTLHLDSEYVQQLITNALEARNVVVDGRGEWEGSVGKAKSEEAAENVATKTEEANPSIAHVWIQWREFEEIDWAPILRAKANTLAVASSYAVRKGLTRKAQFAFILTKYLSKRPNSALHNHWPQTVLCELDHPDYIEEALCDLPEIKYMQEGEVFILKPSILNQALGVKIITCVEDFEEAMEQEEAAEMREWVVQRYIEKPLLYDNRKFHIRAYVLTIGNLSVYLYTDMLALFAVDEYTRDSWHSTAHITNTCAGRTSENFDESKAVRRLQDVLSSEQLESTITQMKECLSETFSAVHSEPTTFAPLVNAFEHFGFDFLLDEDGRLWLLEANAGPDFAQTGDKLQGIVDGVMEETCKLIIDPLLERFQSADAAYNLNLADLANKKITHEQSLTFVQIYHRPVSSGLTSMNVY